jgi:hypothetical protein
MPDLHLGKTRSFTVPEKDGETLRTSCVHSKFVKIC